MLFQMMDQPSRITPSVLRTTAMGIDFLHALFQRTAQSPPDMPLPTGHVLVVDDDPVCTRLVLWALQQAQLHTRSTGDPYEGLQMAKKERFDLILLDIVMPGMDGFEFCRRVRALPDYDSVAIIHFTSNSDFQTRTQSALSGSDDFIAKPVMPMELAVKAVMHLIERYPQS
jgi:DNA-binding response OmpR family regulator